MRQINDLKFVNEWVDAVAKGAGVKQVATKMDMTIESASAKANNLRTKGVELPAMPRNQNFYTVESLNAAIERKMSKVA